MQFQLFLAIALPLALIAMLVTVLENRWLIRRIKALELRPKPPYPFEWPPKPGTILDPGYDYSHLPLTSADTGLVYWLAATEGVSVARILGRRIEQAKQQVTRAQQAKPVARRNRRAD